MLQTCTAIHSGSAEGLLECQHHCLPCRFPFSSTGSSSRNFFMPSITLVEREEKCFRGSRRFNIIETDHGQGNHAQCLCLSWHVAPTGLVYLCSKSWLLCFSCFCLFWSLGLLGLLCGSFCSNELSSPSVFSQGLVGVCGIIPVYKWSWGVCLSRGRAIKLKADVDIRTKGYALSKHKLEIGWRLLNRVMRFLEELGGEARF